MGWIVTDNASNNFTAMKFLAQKIPSFTPEERHIRCLNHVINLAVNALINAISHIEIQDFDEIDKPVIKKRRVSLSRKNKRKRKNQISNDTSNSLPPIIKLRSIVRFIRSSSNHYQYFKNLCKKNDNKSMTIRCDTPTRWNSTFLMIESAVNHAVEINQLCSELSELEINSLSIEDWNILKNLHGLLSVFTEYSVFLETEKYATSFMSIHIFNLLFDTLESVADDDKLKIGADAAHKKLKKYYKLSDAAPAHLISSVLSPSLKLQYLMDNEFEEDYQ